MTGEEKLTRATINYPAKSEYTEESRGYPKFDNNRVVSLSVEYTNRLLGLKLSAKADCDLLFTAGFGALKTVSGECMSVLVPCYRVDVMHQVDIIEDVAIAYGYNNIEPTWRELPTTGRAKPDQRYIDVARELMVGLGYQETLNTTLTNQETLFQKMNMPTN